MVIEMALVAAVVQVVIEVAKVVVKKTKTPKDDKVVAFVAKYEKEILAQLAKVLPKAPPPEPREKTRDHRDK